MRGVRVAEGLSLVAVAAACDADVNRALHALAATPRERYSVRMPDQRALAAIDRIERALARIEASAGAGGDDDDRHPRFG